MRAAPRLTAAVAALTVLGLATPAASASTRPALPEQAAERATDAVTGAAPGRLVLTVEGFKAPAVLERLATTAGIKQIRHVEQLGIVQLEASPDDIPALRGLLTAFDGVLQVEDDSVVEASLTPNDPYYIYEWSRAKIGMEQAWDTTTGGGATIAVLDSGVTPLADLDGAVLPGIDLVNDDNDASDDNGHGTSVAMIAAARGNNDAGMAGSCWNCSVLPVKVLDAGGIGTASDTAAGIVWAVDNGADVINMSLGGAHLDALADAVDYAAAHDVLMVAAAGNDGTVNGYLPAAYPDVISVAGSDETDARYSWSNYGSTVDVAAPGCNVAADHLSTWVMFCGTSSATPLVAGTAALKLAVDPDATREELTDALTITAAPVPGDYVTFGRVDAAATLAYQPPAPVDVTAPTVAITSPAADQLLRGAVTIEAAADDDVAVARVDFFAGGSWVGFADAAPYTTTWSPAGTTTAELKAKATDTAGNVRYSAAVTVTVDNTAPTAAVASPAADTAVRGVVQVEVAAADDVAVGRVDLFAGGSWVGTATAAPWTVALDTAGRTEGPLELKAKVTDTAGNVRYSAGHSIIVDRTAPTGGVLTPTAGATVSGTAYPVTTDAADNVAVAQVDVFLDATWVGKTTTDPTSVTVDTTRVANGSRLLKLKITDTAGNVRYSPAVSVTVAN